MGNTAHPLGARRTAPHPIGARVGAALAAFATACAVALALVAVPTAEASQFTDVPDDHWAQKAGTIDRAVARGLVKGYGDGRFGPDDSVTRAQVVVMLMRAEKVAEPPFFPDNDTSWTDVADGEYYTAALNWAFANDVLSKENSEVRPNDPITREELCAVLSNYGSRVLGRDVSSDEDRLGRYADAGSLSEWARSVASYCVEQGIIGGASELNPAGSATRAETAKMVLAFFDGDTPQAPLYKSHSIAVGQGDATFVELPDGRTMLIDAGPADAADAVVGFIEERGHDAIDYVVMTHPDADHVGAMAEVIGAFSVGQAFAPAALVDRPAFDDAKAALADQGLALEGASAGRVVARGDDLQCKVVLPRADAAASDDANSLVLAVTYLGRTWVYASDARAADLASLGQRAEVLKVSDHGAEGGTTQATVDALRPAHAVISAGGAAGQPSDKVLGLLKGAKTYRTDKQGSLSGCSDGTGAWFGVAPLAYEPPATEPSAPGTPSEPSNPGTATPSPSPSPDVNMQVCVTKSGTKYHRTSCPTVSNSTGLRYMTAAEARSKGFGPCKVCKPA